MRKNGPIAPGDQLMLSSIPGTAMKATGTGAVVGIALEAFDEDRYYSDTYLNQFADDLLETPEVEQTLEDLAELRSETATVTATTTDATDDEVEVQTGQIVMFVDLSYRYLDDTTSHNLAILMGTTSEAYQGIDEDETLFDRLITLAKGFVDGVLKVFAVKVERVQVADELCIEGTCIKADDLRILIEQVEHGVQMTVVEENGTDDDVVFDVTLMFPAVAEPILLFLKLILMI